MSLPRYAVIQVLAYGVDMGGFLLALHSGWAGPIVANVLGKSAAGVFAFFSHRNFTFQSNGRADRKRQAIRYFLLLGLNIPLASGVLALLLLIIPQPEAAKVLADVLCLLLNYKLSKAFVFTKTAQSADCTPSQEARP